jgi:polyhydroxybutyrate depolymerase
MSRLHPLSRIAVCCGAGLLLLFGSLALLRGQRARADARLFAAMDLETVMLSMGTLQRRALIHVPKTWDKKSILPVVFMFHGAGGSPENAIKETGWVEKSDSDEFLVVFPEATRPDSARPAQFGRNNPTWNDGSGRFHSGERRIDDIAFVSALLTRLEKTFPIDKHRIFATGFSNGASMTFRVGRDLPERFAAIAPVSGADWSGKSGVLRKPVALFYLTGDNDPLNPLAGGKPKMASGREFRNASEQAKPPVKDQIKTWAELLGCKSEPIRKTGTPEGITTLVFSEGRDNTEVVFTTIRGQGHRWPGGKDSLPEFIVGRETNQVKATDAIWEFFKTHPRR